MAIDSFFAGFCYGATTVLVGQPLDTIKTLQQAAPDNCKATRAAPSLPVVARTLWEQGGVRAFYRGGMPLLLGGGLMRSAQFGVYNVALEQIRAFSGSKTSPKDLWGGVVDPHVALAGFCGGIGRGMVEGPFEMVKVRRQVQTRWNIREVLKGSGTTLVRNSGLFMSFVIYMDVSRHYIQLSPFWMGGICANMAWLTIWPIDVVKSRVQSGRYDGQRPWTILVDVVRSGHFFRGLLPGLTRSFIANGSSMVVYKYVEEQLKG